MSTDSTVNRDSRIAIVAERTACIVGNGRGGRIDPGVYQVVEIDGAEDRGVVYVEKTEGKLVALSDSDPKVTYATPGEPFNNPDLPAELLAGFVVGTCGHRVAGSEFRAGLTSCERCA